MASHAADTDMQDVSEQNNAPNNLDNSSSRVELASDVISS